MKAYYDLHIHSTLSECASELQTPNNILNMCMLKGLNIISVTDHNTLKHLSTFSKIIESYDILFIYGVEVTVKEGFHVLAYFENLESSLKFDKILESSNLYKLGNTNQQLIYDEFENQTDKIRYKLNIPLSINLEEMINIVHGLDGLIVLAHIDRSSGILEVYPKFDNFDIDAIEIKYINNIKNLYNKYPYLNNYKYLHSSDSHSLESISERQFYLELDSLNFDSFKRALKNE